MQTGYRTKVGRLPVSVSHRSLLIAEYEVSANIGSAMLFYMNVNSICKDTGSLVQLLA